MKELSETALNISQVNGNDLLPTMMTSTEVLDKIDNVLSQKWQKTDEENNDKLQYRSNTMAHVCWHRNCSISAIDYKQALTVSKQKLLFKLHSLMIIYLLELSQWLFIEKIQK